MQRGSRHAGFVWNDRLTPSQLLGELTRQQEMMRRLPGACVLGQLADSVQSLTGADVVAMGLFESPGVLRVTAHAGHRLLRPDAIKVDEGRLVEPASLYPDAHGCQRQRARRAGEAAGD